MSEVEIKQMQEKINAGILLARKRLIEKTKKEDGSMEQTRVLEAMNITPQKMELYILYILKG